MLAIMNTTHATFISRSNRWLATPTSSMGGPVAADRRDAPGSRLDPIDGRGDWTGDLLTIDWAGDRIEVACR
jgi:hypothetical protein